MRKMRCLKIQVDPSGDTPMLLVFFPARDHCGKRVLESDIECAQLVTEALAYEQHRRAAALGLKIFSGDRFHIPTVSYINKEALAVFGFYKYSSRKNARVLRLSLLKEMILFITLSHDLYAWARQSVFTGTTSSIDRNKQI